MNISCGAATAAPIARTAGAMLAAITLVLAGCGDSKKDKPASQTAAKVNKEEITVHQINHVLQQQRGLRPEQTDAASKQILERLIDQELALQKAGELKIDRDTKVVQQIEAARREIVSRAYLEKVGEAATRPTQQEIEKYYADKPALFKERRVYNIQEISIEAKPSDIPELRSKLQSAKNVNDFVEYLKAKDYRFAGNQAVRAAEQLPLASLATFAKMNDGQAVLNQTPTGAQVIVLAGSRSQPVDLQRAAPAIEQFLLNERKRELVAKELKSLREAAKVEYVGKYADAASAPAGAASEPALGASATDSDTVNKGIGIK